MTPRFVSTVDSGNLAAALVALKNGTVALLDKPLLSPALVEGYDDYIGVLGELRAVPARTLKALRRNQKMPWLERLLAPDDPGGSSGDQPAKAAPSWFETQLAAPPGVQPEDDRRLHRRGCCRSSKLFAAHPAFAFLKEGA